MSKTLKINTPEVKEEELKTYSQCGEYYDSNKFTPKKLYVYKPRKEIEDE